MYRCMGSDELPLFYFSQVVFVSHLHVYSFSSLLPSHAPKTLASTFSLNFILIELHLSFSSIIHSSALHAPIYDSSCFNEDFKHNKKLVY